MSLMARQIYGNKKNNASPYVDALSVYSLKKEFTATESILLIRRSSDNLTTWVFFNNSGQIGLDSFTGGSPSVPTATTLATWVGSNDAFVRSWYPQDVTSSRAKFLFNGTNAVQPKLITAGVIETENGQPAIVFNGSHQLTSTAYQELASTLPYTVLSMSANRVANTQGYIWHTQNANNAFAQVLNDRRTNKSLFYINSTTDGFANLNTQVDSSTARLLTAVKDSGSNMTAYYNGVAQGTATFAGTYVNDIFYVGSNGVTKLNGSISLLAIYPTDQTANLPAIHSAINTKYSIY